MQRLALALIASAVGTAAAHAQQVIYYQPPQPAPVRVAANADMGGGFIEFLFGDGAPRGAAPQPQMPPAPQPLYVIPAAPAPYEAAPRTVPYQVSPYQTGPYQVAPTYARTDPAMTQPAPRQAADPRYLRQEVRYDGKEPPGTIIIDTPQRFLYLVEEGGRAIRYGIGVGRPGFTWAGVHKVTAMREWPDWHPPEEMIQRRPDLPRFMAGGPDNPLGARAMYLGNTLYRIHGSNEPWTIGQAVSSGCIRLRNEDVVDLYQRVKVGTKVVVI